MTSPAHVVLSAAPPWGHLRGLCGLAAKLAAERPLVVTLLIPNGQKTFAMSSAEAARCVADVAKPKGELRVVAFGEPFTLTMERMGTAEKDSFDPVWNALMAESPIKCSVTGKEYAAAAKPSLVVLDGLQYALFSTIRAVAPSPPLFVWQSGAAAGIIHYLLPPRLGGAPTDFLTDFTPEERKKGRPFKVTGHVINSPGLPPMYDWELHPADIPHLGTAYIIEPVHFYMKGLNECDGLISACAPGYDGEKTLAAVDAWAAESGKPVYNVGPMRPFKAGTTDFAEAALAVEMAATPPGVGAKVMSFLDSALRTKGEDSVVYICLGTHSWPATNPDHLWTFIDALSERDIPFILSHPSMLAQVPERIQSQYGMESSTNGLIIPWSPQQTVLAHKAVGWFVTHGGAGGTMDGISQGVPMIGWPFMGDQPSNIAYLVHTADVALEFTEVRTGEHGLKPLFASGKAPTGTLDAFRVELKQVLDDMAGDIGARKRANARKMQGELAKAWAEGGSARVTFDAFIEKYGL